MVQKNKMYTKAEVTLQLKKETIRWKNNINGRKRRKRGQSSDAMCDFEFKYGLSW